jgi:glucokinase
MLIGNPNMPELSLGLDLSGQGARIVVVDGRGQVVSRADVDGAASPHAVSDAARRAMAAVKGNVAGMGVAMPGSTDAAPAAITAAMKKLLPRDARMVSISAGTATAVAEQWTGAALGLHGFAASAGWLAMNPVERDDYRRLGGLEAEIASAGIVRRFVWRIKSGDESSITENVKGDLTKITATDIFQGCRGGDGVSVSVVRDTAKYLGMAAANLATMFDPETIVLGGAVAQNGDLMLETIKTECTRRLHPQQAELVRVVLSPLGDDAAAIGAARMAARAAA